MTVDAADALDDVPEVEDPDRPTRLWLVRSLIFGPPSGLLLSVAVNHWRFDLPALVAGVPLLVLYSIFVWLSFDVEVMPWWELAGRAAVVLLGGSVLFMLPRFLTLPATGGFWQPSVVLRLLICCAPYPFVALLTRPRQEFAVALGAWTGLAVIALSWPLALVEARDLAAQTVRIDLGGPSAMYLMIDTPAKYPADGYAREGSALWIAFDPNGGGGGLSGLDYNPDDLDMYVLPADEATPCAVIDPIMAQAVGVNDVEPTACTQTSPGFWVVTGVPESGAVTDVERYRGYYVALSVDSGSNDPIPPSALPGLFATLHPATDSELARAGVFSYWR